MQWQGQQLEHICNFAAALRYYFAGVEYFHKRAKMANRMFGLGQLASFAAPFSKENFSRLKSLAQNLAQDYSTAMRQNSQSASSSASSFHIPASNFPDRILPRFSGKAVNELLFTSSM
jgi:hypothetical protein